MIVNESQLLNIPIPEETKTYVPVPHGSLVNIMREKTYDNYNEEPKSVEFEVAKDGRQMFGTMKFDVQGGEDLCLGFRNSYDKSLSVGVVAGASIIVCSNLMFVGDVMCMRKHTSNVYEDLDLLLDDLLTKSVLNYSQSIDDIESMENFDLDDSGAAHLLGELYVTQDVLSPTLLSIAKKEWFDSNSFKDRNAWSLYNACTEAFKKAHPSERMSRQTDLHKFMMNHVN